MHAPRTSGHGDPILEVRGLERTYRRGAIEVPVLKDLDLDTHHSIRLRIGVKDEAKHPGGINLFGRGFGNYDQDIVMRLETRR